MELFVCFVDFLYIPEWKPLCRSSSDLIFLAELYAMGERFLAQEFQRAVFYSFIAKMEEYLLEKAELCRLLLVACNGITERSTPTDDPMREYIFWLGASRLSDLHKSDDFRALLQEHRNLAESLRLRAGNGTASKPRNPFTSQGKR